MELLFFVILIFAIVMLIFVFFRKDKDHKRKPFNSIPDNVLSDSIMRSFMSRRAYYNNIYLKSDAWQRKRFVVFKRDNYTCVYCGAHATQVHHKRYAKKNIGKEPIDWLVSVCKSCHDAQH